MKIRIPLRAKLRVLRAVGKAAKAAVCEFVEELGDAIDPASDGGSRVTLDEWKEIGRKVGDRVRDSFVESITEELAPRAKRGGR